MPPAGVPGSMLTVTVQVARLDDNDIVGEGDFRDGAVHVADLSAAATFAASLHAPAGPGRAEIPTLDTALALHGAMHGLRPRRARRRGGLHRARCRPAAEDRERAGGGRGARLEGPPARLPSGEGRHGGAGRLGTSRGLPAEPRCARRPQHRRGRQPPRERGEDRAVLPRRAAHRGGRHLDQPRHREPGRGRVEPDTGVSVGDAGATAVYQIVEVEAQSKTAKWTHARHGRRRTPRPCGFRSRSSTAISSCRTPSTRSSSFWTTTPSQARSSRRTRPGSSARTSSSTRHRW